MSRHVSTPTRLLAWALATALGLAGLVALGATPAGAAPACPSYQVIAARGSGETYGRSNTINDAITELARRAVATSTSISFDNAELTAAEYPAVRVNPGEGYNPVKKLYAAYTAIRSYMHSGPYRDSVKKGIESTETRLKSLYAKCGTTTKALLLGYSQGAEVMHKVAKDSSLDSKYRGLISGSIMFGSPLFDPSDPAATGNFDSGRYGLLDPDETSTAVKTVSVCHKYDPICQGIEPEITYYPVIGNVITSLGFDEKMHYNYSQDAASAANKLSRALGWKAPAATPGSGGPLDIVFVVDTTGSMEDDIDGVRSAITDIVGRLNKVSSSWRVAVVDYKDDSENESDYQARLDQPFTTDTSAIQSAIDDLSADGGGDTPESVYSGVMLGLQQPWRRNVAKSIVVMGDAPAKDPEPETGYTLADVTAAAKGVAITARAAGRSTAAATSDGYPASAYSVVTTDDTEAAESLGDIAEATSGKSYSAPAPEYTAQAVTSAVTAAGAGVVVDPNGPYSAPAGGTVKFSGAASTDASGVIDSYEWDFGDGESSAASSSPLATHSYSDSGDYTATLTVTTDSGLTTTAAALVHVLDEPDYAPEAPTGVTATARPDGKVDVSWSGDESYWGTTAGYAVYTTAGDLLATVDGDHTTARIDYLALGSPVAFRVRSLALAGPSDESAASRAVVPKRSTSLTLSRPAKVTSGGRVVAAGRLTDGAGAAVTNARVTVYRRAHGTKRWGASQVVTTGKNGRFSSRVATAVNLDFYARYTGSSTRRASVSRSVTGSVIARVGVSAPKKTRVRSRAVVRVSVAPRAGGMHLALQQRKGGRWTTTRRATCNTARACSIALPTSRARVLTLRVAVGADARTAGGTSRVITVRVKKKKKK